MEDRIYIICQEFLHLYLIYSFFKTNQPCLRASSLRKVFDNLSPIIDDIKEEFKQLQELRSNGIPTLREKIENEESPIFELYETYKKHGRLLEQILTYFDFFSKKASYTLEAFPPYYPSPAIFRARQELKVYTALEKMAESYLRFINQKIFHLDSNLKFKAHVYWEDRSANQFLPSYERAKTIREKDQIDFYFRGSYYMVNHHSLWPILAHEALHFLLNWAKANDFKKSSFFNTYSELQADFLEKMGLLQERMAIELNIEFLKNLFTDAVCDGLLSYVLGKPYFLAIWRALFCFDELNYPIHLVTAWWPRLKISVEQIRTSKGNFEVFNKALVDFHKSIEENIGSSFVSICCYTEVKISEVLNEYLTFLFNQYVKPIEKEELHSYLPYYIVDNCLATILLSGERYIKEGRTYVLSCKRIISKKDEKIKEDIKQGIYKNTQVLLLHFLKFRFDGYIEGEKPEVMKFIWENLLNCQECYFHLGGFFCTCISTNFHSKTITDEFWKNIIGVDKMRSDDKSDIIYEMIEKGCLFYKEDHAASIIWLKEKNKTSFESLQCEKKIREKSIKNFFQGGSNHFLTIIQLKFEEETINQDKKILEITRKISNLEGVLNILITYTFEWADWMLLIQIEGKFLETIKKIKYILLTDNSLQRTKTDVLIGNNLFRRDEKIPCPDIILRLSGEKSQGKQENRVKMLNEFLKEQPSQWHLYATPGIYDVTLSHSREEIALEEFKKFIRKLIAHGLISDIQFRLPLWLNKESSVLENKNKLSGKHFLII